MYQQENKRLKGPFVHYFYHPKRNGTRAILSMSAKEPGCFQITYFVFSNRSNQFIPWSDSILHTIRACLKRMDDDGFERERFQRFNLSEQPEDFVPTPLRDINKASRLEERWMRKIELIS